MKIITDKNKINEILTRGVKEVIEKESLIKKLRSGKQLRIKLGVDPTASELHLGNAVILWKLKEFQELGHKIIFIIGDFTAQIGDPTDKLTARKILTEKEVKINMKTYKKQIGGILDLNKTEIVFNNRHLSKMSLTEIYKISQFFTVDQILERDMFQERKKAKKPIWIHEFMYPLFQAYDSVVVKADVEIGGNDQLFNMMAGRQLQPHFNQAPQDIMTMRILIGTDGKRKMSKSLANYIGVQESATEQYGKIMSIPDELIINYFELCVPLPLKKIKSFEQKLKQNENPKNIKIILAKEIVSLYHGEKKAQETEKEFNKTFLEGGLPKDLPEITIKTGAELAEKLIEKGLIASKTEWRRLIQEGAVRDEKNIKITDQNFTPEKNIILKIGKRRFVKIIV